MKQIGKILAIIVFLGLSLPYVFGIVANRHAVRFVDRLNVLLAKQHATELKIMAFHRGWFSSQILLKMKQTTNGHLDIKTVPIVLGHGPVSFVNGHIMFGVGTVSIADFQIGNPVPCRINAKMHFDFSGGWSAFLLLTQNKVAILKNIVKFHIPELLVRVDSNAAATHIVWHFSGSGLEMVNIKDRLTLKLKNFYATMNQDVSNAKDWQAMFSAGIRDPELRLDTIKNALDFSITANKINFNNLQLNTQTITAILNQLKILLQKKEATGRIDSEQLLNLVQQLISVTVTKNTDATVKNLTLTTPMGQINLNYKIAFPALKQQHDFSKLAENISSSLMLHVPNWEYNNIKNHFGMKISHFMFHSTNKSSSLTNETITLENLFVYTLNPESSPMMTKNDELYLIHHLSLSNQLVKNAQNSSNTTQFDIKHACIVQDCFYNFHDRFEILNLNSPAFTILGESAQKLSSHAVDTSVSKQNQAIEPYLKLITPNTKIVFSHNMTTSSGVTKLTGTLSWPHWTKQTPLTIDSLIQQAVYGVHLILPVKSVNAFLTAPKKAPHANQSIKTTTAARPSSLERMRQIMENAIQKDYFKKINGVYEINVKGHGKDYVFN
ncbi:MAG: hypothetical protein A3E82_07590 [Gammaproteobacteria bacterium RIFCSPHIGHO2_12_FULL_38_11]|nr:MAG: hypothetical protein A3E82_07590 [Gammaproteobacteria bacterium RIFCSPHIGHO2_12_FULL_38_11]